MQTGTLTENKMTVTEGWFAGTRYTDKIPKLADLPQFVQDHIELNIAMNSKAFLIEKEDGSTDLVGNRTEASLLMLLKNWGRSYKTARSERRDDVVQVYGFSSAKKMASVMLKHPDGMRLYNKGAAEIVLERCVKYVDTSGRTANLSANKRNEVGGVIKSMADKGLRTLCLAYRDFEGEVPEDSPDEDLIACCIVGIKVGSGAGSYACAAAYLKLDHLHSFWTSCYRKE